MHDYFTFEQNRSERALQVAYLVPAMANNLMRRDLLSKIRVGEAARITFDEAAQAVVMHFVWVLRDLFSAEREGAEQTGDWAALLEKWCRILGLPEWARDSKWWRHPSGSHKGDPDYVVHPCSRDIGWTEQAILERAKRFALETEGKIRIQTLVSARKIMNTECDCFIQTPGRLIVIECKDKTGFLSEQEDRQSQLFRCLERALPRSNSLVFVEISSQPIESRPNQPWSWDMLEREFPLNDR